MANVIRAQFQNQDVRLNIDKGILTFYGKGKPVKLDIRNRKVVPLLREFLNTAYSLSKVPTKGIVHKTPKNTFAWGVMTNLVERYDLVKDNLTFLLPHTEHTKAILSAMVRANVK